MASIKKNNKNDNKGFQKYGSTDATDINLIDFEDNFDSKNVEGALRELGDKSNSHESKLNAQSDAIQNHSKTLTNHSQTLADHEESIEWLKVNGGGGGGGTSAPTITSSFEDNTIVEKDTDVIIPIFFSSPNQGEGVAYISIDGIEVNSIAGIKQGNNKVNIGKLTNLNNEVSIYVVDRAHQLSNQLSWNIICGGLELDINFDQDADYTVTDTILMQFNVTSAGNDPIIMHLTIDYDSYEITCDRGHNEYVFKGLGVGVHRVTLYCTSGKYSTKPYAFNIVVVNANVLYVSSAFNGGTFEYGTPIPIDYRISKASSELFNVELLLDGKVAKTLRIGIGSYYWTLNDIDVGEHTYEINVTSDYGESASVDGEFTIVAGEYTPLKIADAGLEYRLSAEGRTNFDSDKTLPIDDSGNGIKAELKNFNYYTNGWIDGSLVCDGNAYVEIDAYPWAENVIYGSTIELQYKGLDIGVVGARILDYTDVEPPYKGVYVDLEESTIKSLANTGKVNLDSDEWITLSFVIDRKNKFGKVYIDGICSRAFTLSDTGSGTSAVREDFTHIQKIFLNSRKGIDSFGACEIKDLRIYSRVLSDDEILQNHIAQEKDLVKQKALYDLNYNNKTLPSIRMYGDVTNMTLETPVSLRVKYTSPNEDKYGQSFDLPYCQVNWQGK